MSTTISSEADLKTDVQVIREILFGDQAKNFQQRIETLEAETADLRKALADERKARQKDLEANEERIKNLIAELVQRLEVTDQSQTKALEEMRSRSETRFQQHEAARSSDLKQQNELASALLKAVETYKQYVNS